MRSCHPPVGLRVKLLPRLIAGAAYLAVALVVSLPAALRGQNATFTDEIDSTAPPVVYRGRVVDSQGMPVPGVEVTSEAERNERPWGTYFGLPARSMIETRTRTDQEGRFELAGLRPIERAEGSRILYFEHPAYGLAWRHPYSEYELLKRHEGLILIELQPGVEFGGAVVDLNGRPVAGAVVSVDVSYRDEKDREPPLATRYVGSVRLSEANGRGVTTDAAGRFRLPKLPVGARPRLEVKHSGFVAFQSSVAIEDRHVEIKLKTGATIRGRLLAEEKPVEQAGIEVVAVDRGSGKLDIRAETDDGGHYELTGLDEDEYVVYTRAFTASGKELVATPRFIEKQHAGASVSVDLVCTPGQIVAGRVTDGENGPAADQFVDGFFTGFASRFDRNFTAKTDSEGRYRLRLPPGDYRLSARDWARLRGPGYHAKPVDREVSVTRAAPPDEVDFQLEMVPVHSRLVDEQGRSVSGIFYWWGLGRPLSTNEDGAFCALPVGPSVYAGVSRDKALCRLFAGACTKEDFPEQFVVAPPAKVIGRVIGADDEKFAAEAFKVRARYRQTDVPPGAADFPAAIEVPHDLWRATLRGDGRFELSVPTGCELSFGFGESAWRRYRSLFSIDDLKPGETRDVGDVDAAIFKK